MFRHLRALRLPRYVAILLAGWYADAVY